VRTRVVKLINRYIIMNHLMQNRILDERLRQVNPRVDAEGEIFVPVTPEKALPAPHKSNLAEKAFGMTQFNRNRRQRATEKPGVVLIKTRLYVFNRRCHNKSNAKVIQKFGTCKHFSKKEQCFFSTCANKFA